MEQGNTLGRPHQSHTSYGVCGGGLGPESSPACRSGQPCSGRRHGTFAPRGRSRETLKIGTGVLWLSSYPFPTSKIQYFSLPRISVAIERWGPPILRSRRVLLKGQLFVPAEPPTPYPPTPCPDVLHQGPHTTFQYRAGLPLSGSVCMPSSCTPVQNRKPEYGHTG